ncbi:hypothetical protein EVAR_100451_1 [Eumeta japonica]|uniref:Histone-lysine N-methyltransferase SETMAR n=1 Tax=Eumeta variegata TaxID=151549 RepID=A0A4C2A099_EUMVA|nr:hypothetical protein EVAR_100451_1 [Eumeta japonica]
MRCSKRSEPDKPSLDLECSKCPSQLFEPARRRWSSVGVRREEERSAYDSFCPRPARVHIKQIPSSCIMRHFLRSKMPIAICSRFRFWLRGRLISPRPKIAEELQISKERVGEIIHEHMNMRKISALGTKMLTPFDKQRRLQTNTRGSRTEATWEVIARSAVLQTMHLSTRRGFRGRPWDTGFSKLTTTLQPRSSSSDYFLFQFKKRVTWS